ncbi:Acetyl-CoA:oxalate CoA-transferase [Tepidimonas thermarum]|uniref:Acetyl-CoA:oxalate CoA-transferase n=1 Tax=Tepidimonas thermarum TaxID=335431 RepID=A0A554X007_9BURK|nr:CaiB/BaiF CoA-transferase family protein [Tepidimonas thermarum]TSE29136.1 Acetyl-CoA:oxalate CoA-transferase [Tepidimonas thermarum]
MAPFTDTDGPFAAAEAPRPLTGVRVLDLSRVLAGPWASQILADYGADVIKVERPGSGDDTRAWGPPWWQPDPTRDTARVAAYFVCANRGKRSVAIDITTPAGIEQVRTLARDADVLIENYKVGQLAKYGLDARNLQALNPQLIYCSITGYGQTGPLAHKAGYDFAIQAEGGLMSITGEPDGEPQKVGVAVTDLMTGVYAATAILAALHERQRTGRGRVLDASLFDVQVAMLANQASNQLIGQRTPGRMGNAHPNIVPYQAFPTQDGHLVLAVGNDSQFQRFCEVAGHPAVARDVRFATNPARVEHRNVLVPLITEWTRTRTTADWVQALDAVGVPCAPIHDIAQVMAHPHVRARGMVLPAAPDRPPMVAHPVLFDGQRPTAPRPPPALGADPAQWDAPAPDGGAAPT